MAYHYREVSWKSKMQIEFSYNNEENIHWLPKTAFQLTKCSESNIRTAMKQRGQEMKIM
jgi:hypothetical protein